MKEQTTTFEYPKFEFLVRHIKNRIHTFSSRKAYQTRKTTNENAKALFSNAKNRVLSCALSKPYFSVKGMQAYQLSLKTTTFLSPFFVIINNNKKIPGKLVEFKDNLTFKDNLEVTIW